MSVKPKTSDDEIRKYINDGLTNAQIAKVTGITPGGIYGRCDKLREKINGVHKYKFGLDDKVIWCGKIHTVIRLDDKGFVIRELKSLRSQYFTWAKYEDRKDEIVKVQLAEEKPKKQKPKKLDNLTQVQKPTPEATNEAYGDESAENDKLTDDGSLKAEIVDLSINLEIDSITDPVEHFSLEPEDYTDPEWFDKPLPKEGTVERVIWNKAYAEIKEIQTLRSTILSALNRGERLPSTEVEKYNKYVSKYQEAGA